MRVLCVCLSHLCFSWSPCGLSPCPVSQLQETQACLPQWPRLIPRPGEDTDTDQTEVSLGLFHS